MKTKTLPQFFTIKQAAERLGLSYQTIYKLVTDGVIEAAHIGAGTRNAIRISEPELIRYIESVTTRGK